MNKEVLEAHVERKNKRFYGYVGKQVMYYFVFGEIKKAPVEAVIVKVHDEDCGVVDLYISDKSEHLTATIIPYNTADETKHEMIIHHADDNKFIKHVQHIDFGGINESYWAV